MLPDFGAAIEGRGTRKWGGPLSTALAFGMSDAAKLLTKRGAHIDLPAVGRLGLVDDAARLLPSADAEARHRALALAAQHGHVAIVRLLLDRAVSGSTVTYGQLVTLDQLDSARAALTGYGGERRSEKGHR